MKLEGPELDEFLKKKQEKESEENRKKAQEKRYVIELAVNNAMLQGNSMLH